MNVIKNSILFIVLNLTFACSNTPQKGQIQKIRHDGKVTDKVNVFIGTGAHCHNFPSAMVPFGAVVAGPDCNTKGWDAAAGYHYDAPTILGFSQQHLSGTGLIELGDLLLVPAIGKIKVNPGTEENPDAGYRNSSSVWAPNRQVHFAMKFSKPFKSHHLYDADKKQFFDTRNDRGCRQLKVIFDFDTQKDEAIMVKIAVSSVSMENALQNLEAEIPGWDFEKVRKEADDKWINEFQRFYAKGSKENIAKFYAALYHTMIHPSILNDVNGQYRGISKMPAEAKGFTKYQMFSLWDTFRALHPLFTIIQQKRTDDIVKSMVDFYKRNPRKMLPMWSMYQDENTCMIGLHALPVIADAYSKGLLSSSPDELLAAMVESSERHGVDNTISRAEYPSYYGQQYYLKKGYHPNDLVRSGVSVTLEHAYDDWTVALAAHQMGNDEVAEKFLKRSQNYRNVWDKETGFFRARLNDGTFREPFDPRAYHREDFNDRDYVEGNAWQYLYFVPHDVYGLMELMGGAKVFADRLEEMFNLPHKESNVGDVSGLIGDYAHGNEPCHHYAYLYDYAGRPWKTQEVIHQVDKEFYKAAHDGYIGNEDAGQMSAWYVFSAMGFYPVNPAGGIYIIGSPLLEEVQIALENGNKFTMKANNLSDENIYIQSVSLNGKPWNNVWLNHDDIISGASLIFEMGNTPSEWGVSTLPVPYANGKVIKSKENY
ncbi:MAG: GH92 family glycosyl hydrolase [Prolixibacteraceae bacterium]|nr:GH92 family glycosyl hydrolase [Prolixibacteraceae bacterium]